MLIIIFIILVLVLCSIFAALFYMAYKNRLEKKVIETQIVSNAAIILYEYSKLRIDKYSEEFTILNKYIEHHSTIFYDLVQNKNLKVDLINVQLEKSEENARAKLMYEFKNCGEEYSRLFGMINVCLEMIYKHNHPIKYKLYLIRKKLNLYLIKLLILLIKLILIFLGDDKKNNNNNNNNNIDSYMYNKEIVYVP